MAILSAPAAKYLQFIRNVINGAFLRLVRVVEGTSAALRLLFRDRAWQPLISVVVANFNHGQFLRSNLDGLLAQNYRNWEAIIVDDASTDDSRDIVAQYQAADARVRALHLPSNLGAIAAFLKGYAEVRGELLYCSAADDYVSDPTFFDNAVRNLAAYPGAGGFAARTRIVDSNSSGVPWDTGPERSGYLTSSAAVAAFFENRLFVPGSSVIWKSTLVREIGFLEDLGPQVDYYLNHALTMKWGVVLSDQVSATMRKSGESFSGRANDKDFFNRHRLVLTRLVQQLPEGAVPAASRDKWRMDVINARLAVTRQQEFFSLVRNFFQAIQTWEESSLPPQFVECRSNLLDEIAQLEQALAVRIEEAKDALR